jgi:gas vesicle protein
VALSNEEKQKIMNDLAQGKPGLVQEPTFNLDQYDSNFDNKDYDNFEDFAQRPVDSTGTQTRVDGNLVERIRTQIRSEFEEAKSTGQLRTSRIREIVQSAIYGVRTEIKAGTSDIRQIFKDTISAVGDNFKDKGSEIKEEVTAAVEGFIAGYSSGRRQSIIKDQAQVHQLQSSIDTQEEELQQEIDRLLVDVEEVSKESDSNLKDSIQSAINAFKNSEEFALMKKRYAQLQAQLAILRANLAARYGGRYEEIKERIDEATHWYKRTGSTEAGGTLAEGRSLEERLKQVGEAIAKGEHQLRKVLSDLLKVASDLLREKDTPSK